MMIVIVVGIANVATDVQLILFKSNVSYLNPSTKNLLLTNNKPTDQPTNWPTNQSANGVILQYQYAMSHFLRTKKVEKTCNKAAFFWGKLAFLQEHRWSSWQPAWANPKSTKGNYLHPVYLNANFFMWDFQIQGFEHRFAKKNPKITVTASGHQERS